MSTKYTPKLTSTSRGEVNKIAEIVGHNVLKKLPVLGGVLSDLIKARGDEIKASMANDSQRRFEEFMYEMLGADSTMDEATALALLKHSDFHALLRGCLADIEEEKIKAYASLTRGVATGQIEQVNRKHFIISLRDLSYDALVLLQKAYVAISFDLIPATGGDNIHQDAFLSLGQPGSFTSIHVADLTSRGFIHVGNLSDLGVKFTEAVWPPYLLTPEAIQIRAWSDQNVLIVGNNILNDGLSEARELGQTFRDAGCKTSIVSAVLMDIAKVVPGSTSCVLLFSDDTSAYTARFADFNDVMASLPTIGVLLSPGAKVPAGLAIKKTVLVSDEKNQKDWNSVVQAMFEKTE